MEHGIETHQMHQRKDIRSSSQGFGTHIYVCVHLHVLD